MASTTVPPKPEKAYLAILPPSMDGGGASAAAAQSGGGGVAGALDQFTFQFNPSEYSIRKSASWKRNPDAGSDDAGIPEFLGAEPRTFTVKYLIDASGTQGGDLKPQLDLLFSCCAPTAASKARNTPKPPFVLFGWGTTTSFTACVRSVTAEYKMFSPEGKCIRATGTLELEEIPSQQKRQNPTSGGVAVRRTHTVVAGDTLASIAFREYGRPDLWRALAELNGIDDPLRLRAGTHLMVPASDDLPTRS